MESTVFHAKYTFACNQQTFGESNIKSSSCVKNLGASLDSKLNMWKHVNMSLNLAMHSYGKSITSEKIPNNRCYYIYYEPSRNIEIRLLMGVPTTVLNKLQNV